MSNFTITIVGTGVIGTSLGLALKQEKDPPRLLGHDKELDRAKAALKLGAFDKAEWNLVNACEPADLIILAVPLSGIRPTLAAIAPYLKPGVVISDTARSKAPVLAWATELLPPHAHFVGGDPLVQPAGSDQSHTSAVLFRDRLYCLTPAPNAEETAVQLMVSIIGMLGAKPFFLDAAEHDGLVAAVETLPSVLGIALLQTVAGQPAWREMRKLAGSLFDQTSSGASGDPDSLQAALLAQRSTLLHWLDRYLAQLQELRALLSADEGSHESLLQKLDQAIVERHNWQVDYQQGHFDDPELATPTIERPGLMRQLIGFGGGAKKQGSRGAEEQGRRK
ncbi:MAG: prephenate dehydrogenase [Anaerolineae bacterium]|nr:prephenate dehydrogenase [Anaerolineae bacterium]